MLPSCRDFVCGIVQPTFLPDSDLDFCLSLEISNLPYATVAELWVELRR